MLDFWQGAEELPIYGYLIRAAIVYTYIFILLKILGQRSISAINPLDFLFGVIIGDVVGEPLAAGDVPLPGPLAAAALIAGLHLFLSWIALKLPRFRRVIEDEPIVLIKNGKIIHEQLSKNKITVESLMMDLRLRSAIDLTEVDYAVLESNGQISVIKKSAKDSATAEDVGLSPPSKGYPTVLIEDGHVVETNLHNRTRSKKWLLDQLEKKGIKEPKDCFLMTLDEAGTVFISERLSEEQQNHILGNSQ
ncbi:DUF421 domain-containing protein [Alteribacter natronophilus]|uniref:DUF421 domain-containing protein n=1 Tax=Alteribacter natronophilus TaxID=2583810 RepID=UPI00110DDDD2|nr:DUF421 domain-containing protein [Alteribacter natronophilus]TMW73329.1 DUF421 domain-containing protein [Alteribacter natronophilus]